MHGDVVQPSLAEADVIVGGPLCESGDIFTQEAGGYVRSQRLPRAAVGDYLVIGCTSCSPQFAHMATMFLGAVLCPLLSLPAA